MFACLGGALCSLDERPVSRPEQSTSPGNKVLLCASEAKQFNSRGRSDALIELVSKPMIVVNVRK